MPESRVFDTIPEQGITKYFHFDPVTNGFTIETVQDFTELKDQNLGLQCDTPEHWRGDWHRVASIPLTVYFKMLQERHIQNDPKELKKIINDRDYLTFRTRPGRV